MSLHGMKDNLSETLSYINPEITHQNRPYQLIPDIGYVKPSQLYLHQNIEKSIYRKNSSGKREIKRIPENTLVDGVHPTQKVTDIWFNGIHNCFAQAVHDAMMERRTYLKNGRVYPSGF